MLHVELVIGNSFGRGAFGNAQLLQERHPRIPS
jgi:hypothetical protein